MCRTTLPGRAGSQPPVPVAEGDVLAEVAAAIPDRGPNCVIVGIDGVDGAGKTTFADALAKALARPAVRISVDDFHSVRAIRHRRGHESPDGFWLDAFDYERLIADVFEPLRTKSCFRRRAHDLASDQVLLPPWEAAPTGAVVIVDGLFLQRRELAGRWDFVVFLDAPFDVTARRLDERDGPSPGGYLRYVGAALRYFAACDPKACADILIDNSDPGAPRIVRRGQQA
jgi:uridine kinase